jgi:phosphomannomutase/phosphoglucomutase
MQINPFIFRNYDIRGKVPDDLDIEKAEAIGRAYGTFLRRRGIGNAVVGRDCRVSSSSFAQAYIKGLLSTVVDVVDIGMVLTQMVYFAQYYLKFPGATMITASHNPAAFNGFKMATGYSQTMMPADVEEIKKAVAEDDFFPATKKGNLTFLDIKDFYAEDLLGRVSLPKKIKVLVDFRHGTPGVFVPDILRRAGCEVVEKRSAPDGFFPSGTPDPTDRKFMEELGKEVVESGADIGLAFDGDGDRVGFVDEKGEIVWNDALLAIFAQDILKKNPGGKIIFNLLSSEMVPEVILKNNGRPIIWLVGHSFIKEKVFSENAVFGGEISGHLFFKDNFYGHDDGVYAALRLLRYLGEKDKKLSEIVFNLPKYFSSPEIKIACSDDKKKQVLTGLAKKLKEDFPTAEIIDDKVIPGNDGLRINFPDGMMVFRYSQNGPYITVRFEAKDEKRYNERRKYVKNILQSFSEIEWKTI